MAVSPEEWFKQAYYDADTAEYMFQGGRHYHAVFICHLAVEKALKGILHKRTGIAPTHENHDLIALSEQVGLILPEHLKIFFIKLNEAYMIYDDPVTIEERARMYPGEVVGEIIKDTRKAIKWIQETL
jgi:HEPN domain-containing protein